MTDQDVILPRCKVVLNPDKYGLFTTVYLIGAKEGLETTVSSKVTSKNDPAITALKHQLFHVPYQVPDVKKRKVTKGKKIRRKI